MRTNKFYKIGQSIIEYALLISIVSAAIAAMSLYVQRSVQANVRIIEKQINAHPANPLG
jgi:Flp pilus assembly pilin Flp